MLNGKVKWFDPTKGYGFILYDGKEIFVHYSQILVTLGGIRLLCEGEPVDFEISDGRKGPQAVNVRRLDPPADTRRPTRFRNNNSNDSESSNKSSDSNSSNGNNEHYDESNDIDNKEYVGGDEYDVEVDQEENNKGNT